MSSAVQQPDESRSQLVSDKHFLAVLSFMWGMFGVDRFYLGKWVTGLVKLVTFGGFGVWLIVDLAIIMTGGMRDAHGRPLKDFEQYKGFAAKTVLWFAIVTGIVTLVLGIATVYGLYELAQYLIDSQPTQWLPMGGGSPYETIPALNQL